MGGLDWCLRKPKGKPASEMQSSSCELRSKWFVHGALTARASPLSLFCERTFQACTSTHYIVENPVWKLGCYPCVRRQHVHTKPAKRSLAKGGDPFATTLEPIKCFAKSIPSAVNLTNQSSLSRVNPTSMFTPPLKSKTCQLFSFSPPRY